MYLGPEKVRHALMVSTPEIIPPDANYQPLVFLHLSNSLQSSGIAHKDVLPLPTPRDIHHALVSKALPYRQRFRSSSSICLHLDDHLPMQADQVELGQETVRRILH